MRGPGCVIVQAHWSVIAKWCVSFDPCAEPCSHWLLRVAEVGTKCLPGGLSTRKLRLGPGSEIVCQSVTIRHNSVLNR